MSLSACYKKPNRVQGFSTILFFPYINNKMSIGSEQSYRYENGRQYYDNKSVTYVLPSDEEGTISKGGWQWYTLE